MSRQTKANSIRIIAGRWRGRRLSVIDAVGLRPTTDRVRERVFSWLMHDLPGARCLDLFAGSGALGLESLSRDARYVQFVDLNRRATKNIQANLQLLSGKHSEVINADAIRLLQSEVPSAFDIVFLDPPFASELLSPCAALLEARNWLAEQALIYIEYDARKTHPVLPENWQAHRQGTSGQTAYGLYRSVVS